MIGSIHVLQSKFGITIEEGTAIFEDVRNRCIEWEKEKWLWAITRLLSSEIVIIKHTKTSSNHCMFGFQNWIEDDNTVFAAENRNRAMAMVLEKNYLEVKKLLVEHRDLLDRMAMELIDKTTLVYSDVQRIFTEI